MRVWSRPLKLKDARGVVTCVASDTLAFIAPSGWRQPPREFVAGLQSLERAEVLTGRSRSLADMTREGMAGAIGGAAMGGPLGYRTIRVLYLRYAGPEDHLTRDGIRRYARAGAQIVGTAWLPA